MSKFILFCLNTGSISFSLLSVTWAYVVCSDHRAEKSLQSNHSLHSPKLAKLPGCLLTTVWLKTEIVPLTDIICKWHSLVCNYPGWYVVERVSQLWVVTFYSLGFFPFFLRTTQWTQTVTLGFCHSKRAAKHRNPSLHFCVSICKLQLRHSEAERSF